MGKTTIEWCDMSVNPVRARHKATGKVGHFCVKVSPGCAHCYSSRMQPRFGMPPFEARYADQVEPFFDEHVLDEVVRRKKPTKWFWCDMSDLFGEWVPDLWIDQCFSTMARTPQHTHQILSKRVVRMQTYSLGLARLSAKERSRRFIAAMYADHPARRLVTGTSIPDERVGGTPWPLKNVWFGHSVENQATADQRLWRLRQTPAAVRFVSYEPALAAVDFKLLPHSCYVGAEHSPKLDLIIIGGESGPDARPFDLAWARSAIAQCRAAGVKAFFKQAGSRPVIDEEETLEGWPDHVVRDTRRPGAIRLRDRKGGDLEELPAEFHVREFPS